MHSRIGVGVLLQREGDDILLGRRDKHGEPVTWCLPGGHVEPGESFELAALRELTEETGVEPAAEAKAFAIVVDPDADAVSLTAGVHSRVRQACPKVTEPHIFSEWAWFPPTSLPRPLFRASEQLLLAWWGRREPGTYLLA